MNKIKILTSVLKANDQLAGSTREWFNGKGITAFNMMSSPGSGKTTIIESIVGTMKDRSSVAVLEGDIETTLDSERISKKKVKVVSINTGPFGGDCHLEASWIRTALGELDLKKVKTVIIENIGNLVCPAEFDTGSHRNIVVLSVPEGDDKPAKYPLAFNKADLVILNKIDLLPYVDFDKKTFLKNLRSVNPKAKVIETSGKTGSGIHKVSEWMDAQRMTRRKK